MELEEVLKEGRICDEDVLEHLKMVFHYRQNAMDDPECLENAEALRTKARNLVLHHDGTPRSGLTTQEIWSELLREIWA